MERLKEQGWYLSEQGFDLVSDSGRITDIQKLIKRAIDMDLKEIGSGEADINQGNLVLQIQKLRNVAAPKSNEESHSSPRLLKFYLTDGKNNYQAIEGEHIPSITINTPPGTKFILNPTNLWMSHGIILLNPSNIVSILGGKVQSLIEKWELNKKLALHTRVRSADEGGPPPWIPFGKKIIKVTDQDKNSKSTNEKDIVAKDNTEFEAQRKDAIAEAARQGSKKVFGGGTKQLLDHTVQRIVDHGFTVDQAEYALKVNRNNVDRALKSLQRNDNRGNNTREPRDPKEPKGKRFEKKVEETKPSSGKVSLFDFLEDKLPAQLETVETHTNNAAHNFGHSRLDNHFERNEGRGAENHYGKGGRGQRGGRGSYQAPPRHSEESKFSKRPSNENYNASSYSSSGSLNPGKPPPRFQRNQQQSQHKPEQNFRSNHGRSTDRPTDRRNDFPGNYNKNQTKNPQNENSNRFYNNGETDSFSKQNDFGNNTNLQNRVPHDSSHKKFDSVFSSERNLKNQSNPEFKSSRSFGGQNKKSQGHFENNKNNASGGWTWKVGDQCMAKYWEDNRYYNAEVTAVSSRTCVVLFNDFCNYEEVLQVDCIPISEDFSQTFSNDVKPDQRKGNHAPRHEKNYSGGGMEFRRGGGGSGANHGNKGFNRKRGQQRSAQPIYEPPAQRGHAPSNARDNL